MSGRIGVVVGDDHPVVREGVVRLINASDDIEVLAEAADGLAVVELIRSLRPRVALVDFRMPGLDGAQVAATVRRELPDTRVLLLSAHTDAAIVFETIAQGAAGFLSKEAGKAEILAAIREVAAGRDIIPPQLAGGLFGEIRARREEGSPVLSTREREVLVGMAAGKSVPAMAREMFLATSTVKTHTRRLYDKLGVADRSSAVAEAMRRGLLR